MLRGEGHSEEFNLAAATATQKCTLCSHCTNRCVRRAGFSEVSAPLPPSAGRDTQAFFLFLVFLCLHLHPFFGGFCFLAGTQSEESISSHPCLSCLDFVTILFESGLHRRGAATARKEEMSNIWRKYNLCHLPFILFQWEKKL